MIETITKEQIIHLISELYSPLTDVCKADFALLSEIKLYEKSTLFVKENHKADHMYFVVKGCIRAFYTKDDRTITDWFAFENEFISSVDAFFTGVPSTMSMEALEDLVVLEISREEVEKLSNAHCDFDRMGRIAITHTVLKLRRRITELQFETAQQKYDSLLAYRPDIIQRVALTHIASYLGMSLETLSRVRNPKNRI